MTKGQLLAREGGREVGAGANGRILLPLYQGQGDAYFLCRGVWPFWLHLACRKDGFARRRVRPDNRELRPRR